MRLNQKLGTVLWRIIQVGIIVLTVIGYIKGIFISLDIDESYAVAQSYRLAMGEHLFADMWESHQLSAFLSAIFIKVYVTAFHTTDYLVIYLRVVGMLIHMGFGVLLYRCLEKKYDKNIAFLIGMLHLNFFPKWVQMPEFEIMHYWFLLLIFLLLHQYFAGEKKPFWQPLLAGVCLVGSMMSYPTMVMLYPVYILGLCLLERQLHERRGIKAFHSGLWLTVGASVSGIGFLLYLISYQTPQELIHNISYVFMDASHTTYTMAEKWGMYGGQIGDIALDYLEQMLVSVVMVLIATGVLWGSRKLRKNPIRKADTGKYVEYMVLSVLVLTAILLQIEQMVGCLFEDENQFYMQVRYIAAIVPAVYLGIRYHNKMAVYFWLCVMPALVSLPAVLFITNMNVNVTCSRAVLGIWGSLIMLKIYLQEEMREDTAWGRGLTFVPGLCVLAGFFLCRLVMIRVTGCLPVTVMAPKEKMAYGPEKGIYILEEQAQIWNDNYSVLKDVIHGDDRLLYIGAENLIYPAMGCELSTPSTQGTTVFNEMFLQYYKEHPDKLPTIVVIDKSFGTNPVYGLFSDARIVTDWLCEQYPDARVQETAYMTILFLEE